MPVVRHIPSSTRSQPSRSWTEAYRFLRGTKQSSHEHRRCCSKAKPPHTLRCSVLGEKSCETRFLFHTNGSFCCHILDQSRLFHPTYSTSLPGQGDPKKHIGSTTSTSGQPRNKNMVMSCHILPVHALHVSRC